MFTAHTSVRSSPSSGREAARLRSQAGFGVVQILVLVSVALGVFWAVGHVGRATNQKLCEQSGALASIGANGTHDGDCGSASQPELPRAPGASGMLASNAEGLAAKSEPTAAGSGPAIAASAEFGSSSTTPPGDRILGHEWVDSDALGQARIEETYDEVSTLWARFYTTVANVIAGADLDRKPQYRTQAHRITYTTQDRGRLVEATGVVVVPVVEEPREFPLLLVLHGYGGIADDAAVSDNWFDFGDHNQTYAQLGSVIASQGYVAVLPDYIGINSNEEPDGQLHPAFVAEPTAIASLDAARAARNLLPDLESSRARPGKIGVWGASQGGHAAAFTTRYAPHYAPDVDKDIAGAVYAIPPLDFGAQWQRAMAPGTENLEHVLGTFSGMADWYGMPTEDVFQAPYDAVVPNIYDETRHPTLHTDVPFDELFTPSIVEANREPYLAGDPAWNRVLRKNSYLTTSVPRENDVPALVVVGENDELVAPDIQRATFEQLVERGETWMYKECAGAAHTQAFLQTMDDALDFFDARFRGDEMPIGTGVRLPATDCSN